MDIDKLINEMVAAETTVECNPFLSTRVMATLEKQEVQEKPFVLKPAVIALGIMAAVFLGVAAGSLYREDTKEDTIVLYNDSSTENFAFFIETENN